MKNTAPATVVTGLVDIGRSSHTSGHGDGRTLDFYRPFLERVLRLQAPLIAYLPADPDTESAFDWLAWATQIRLQHTPDWPTRFVPTTLDTLPAPYGTAEWRRRVVEIQADPSFRSTEIMTSPDRLEGRSPGYLAVIYSKLTWAHRVAEENPFRTPYVVWVDAGSGRWVTQEALDARVWPAPWRAHAWMGGDRLMIQCRPPTRDGALSVRAQCRAIDDSEVFARTDSPLVMAGCFGGTTNALRLADDTARYVLEHGLMQRRLVNGEQVALTLLWRWWPSRVHVVEPPAYGGVLPVVHELARPLRIVLVGPGIMEIPPRGWGAVEALVWNLLHALRAEGHDVHLVNVLSGNTAEERLRETVVQVRALQPDVVHLQYDVHVALVPHLVDSVPHVLLTSHFGYLPQPDRTPEHYRPILEAFVRATRRPLPHNVHVFALSPLLVRRYVDAGADPRHVHCVPNGVETKEFRWSPRPAHPDRTLCLGKIDPRKRQYELRTLDAVWFAGNVADERWPPHHPHHLGEWTKAHLYETLTEYANLVLLSDGEAHALVCAEAMAAGLGLVLSEPCTANLDLSLPFIRVISADRLTDLRHVEEVLAENRRTSLSMREAIRQYARDTFDWTHIVRRRYLPALRNVLCRRRACEQAFDFVEIGTSDFDTLLQTASPETRGLSVEPLPCYLDALPSPPNVIKDLCAVSDADGEADVYYVEPDDLVRHRLPNHLRGTNSLGRPHPTTVRDLLAHEMSHLLRKRQVPVRSYVSLMRHHGVHSVQFLKVDTEGHDPTVLRSLVAYADDEHRPDAWPQRIEFESNGLALRSDEEAVLAALLERGYGIVQRDLEHETTLALGRFDVRWAYAEQLPSSPVALRCPCPHRSVVLHIDCIDEPHLDVTSAAPWCHVLVLVEPRAFGPPDVYARLPSVAARYDRILTHDPGVLQAFPGRAECANLNAVTWLTRAERDRLLAVPKRPAVSHLCGGKNASDGHRLRQWVWNQQSSLVGQTTPLALEFYQSGNYAGALRNPLGNPVLGPSKSVLFEGMFHVCIENVRQDDYFSEKLLDCLVARTVPVYWGCPNIGRYFDLRGFVRVANRVELRQALETECTADTYARLRPYVETNGRLADAWVGDAPKDFARLLRRYGVCR